MLQDQTDQQRSSLNRQEFVLTEAVPGYRTYLVNLPLCTLHVMEAGSGPPLIMVPATISELDNWRDLVRFMAQWFRVYFFELPGHGLSTPFSGEFSSDLVAQAVGQFVDHIGAERFNLMGFSFGGVLAMKTFVLLRERIDRLVLIAPCITCRALLLSRAQQFTAHQLNRLLKAAKIRSILVRSMQSRASRRGIARLLHLVGKVEHYRQLDGKLASIRPSVIEVVSHELDEILGAEFPHPQKKHSTPCYFAMSIYDPLLDHQMTLDELRHHFKNIQATELYFPFHQPPRPFTFDELNRDFAKTVAEFMRTA